MSSKILIIEDDERIRTSMTLSLEDEGYEVIGAQGAEQALDFFSHAQSNQPFDLVIIDIMLPGMDGFAACRELRRQSALPIVMVTARTDTPDIASGVAGVANGGGTQ